MHGVDFDPIKNLQVIIQSPVDTDSNHIRQNKKDICLGNIVHGIDFDNIKNLQVTIQSPVDTDLNHIRHKQKKFI